MKFPLGRVVATPGALRVLKATSTAPQSLLARHAKGDWGDVPPEDVSENEMSLVRGYRLMSSYPVGDQKVWIITEADRSATTLLLPEEY